MNVDRLAVIGAGAMGRGIAEVAAVHGMTVTVIETVATQIQAAEKSVQASLAKAVQREKLTGELRDAALSRMTWKSDLDSVGDCPVVIEAISEQEELKRTLFRELDRLCPPATILASNTSSISITRIAAVTKRPAQVVGMHFFNPVPVMQPVEIVSGLETSQETVAAIKHLAERMGKQAFIVKDSPGFVVNRVLLPLINEAIFTLQEGIADAPTIDSLTKLGCNHPMGPLQLADFVGLDICLAVLRVLHEQLGDPKYRPCPLLVRMVDAGHLGKKSGRGFYEYK